MSVPGEAALQQLSAAEQADDLRKRRKCDADTKPAKPTKTASAVLECKDHHMPTLLRDMTKPQIGHIQASSVLLRAQSFLPRLQQENAVLKKKMESEPAANFDIEVMTPGQDNAIEMELFAGVFDVKGKVPERPLDDDVDHSQDTGEAGADGHEVTLDIKPTPKAGHKVLIDELT